MRNLLSASLRRLVVPEPTGALGPYKAHTIAVCASKGGVGKTTTAVHLAAGLARLHGRRVLLVDLDAQGHVGTSLRGLTPSRAGQLAELLEGSEARELCDIAVATQVPNLHITAPDKALTRAEASLTSRIGREMVLRRALKRTRTHYEFVVMDCPPNLGNLTLNALLAADSLVIPCDPSVFSMEGVDDLLGAIDRIGDTLNHHPQLLGVLRTRVDRRNRSLHEAVDEALKQCYGDQLFKAEIGVNTAITKAQIAGHTVWHEAPRCRGAADYARLVTEVLERLEGRPAAN